MKLKVYCTEPVMHFGRMLMDDLVANVKNDQTVIMVNNEKFRREQLEKAKTTSKFPIFSSLENLSLILKNNQNDDENYPEPASKHPKLQSNEGKTFFSRLIRVFFFMINWG